MNVTLKRDGLTLRGELLKPDVEKCPILIIFHGFMANIGKDDKSMFYQIAHECLNNGIATIRFDFDGHGDSDGEFCDMNVLSEKMCIRDRTNPCASVYNFRGTLDVYT